MAASSTKLANLQSDVREQVEHSPGTQSAPLIRLVAWTISIAAVWLIVLPWLAIQPSIDSQVQWLEEQGVDPSAMFYTELEVMKPILQRFNERRRHGQIKLESGLSAASQGSSEEI
jgi:hypothetical protein